MPFILALLLAFFSAQISARDVTLAWDASASPDVAGYRLHYGTQPSAYMAAVDVGPVTTATIAGLDDSTTYFIAATAYGDGKESGFSNEVVLAAVATVPLGQGAAIIKVTKLGDGPPGQIAVYDFSTGGGATVFDRSGQTPALDLIIDNPGNVTWLAAGLRINSASVIRTSGNASRLRSAIQASNAYTVESWITPANTTQGGPARIVAYSQSGSVGGNFLIGQSTNRFVARARNTGSDAFGWPELIGGTASMALAHAVLTYESGARRLYINGVQVATGAVSGVLSNWIDVPLALANEPAGGRAWLGTLYYVAIYSRVLTASEINSRFQIGIPGS